MASINVSDYELFCETNVKHIDNWMEGLKSDDMGVYSDTNGGAFLWETTPEGRSFWQTVHGLEYSNEQKHHALNVLKLLKYNILLGLG